MSKKLLTLFVIFGMLFLITSCNEKKEELKVTFKDLEKITLQIGETVEIGVEHEYEGGYVEEYIALGPEILSVDADGVVTALKAGTAEIEVNFYYNEQSVSHTYTITVEEKTMVKINYHLNGGTYDGPTEIKIGESLELGKATKTNADFLGWGLIEKTKKYVTKLTNVTEDTDLYAIFDDYDPTKPYTVSLDLGGGSLRYSSRDEMIADFLKDFNATCGKSWTSVDDIPTGNYAGADSWDTFYKNSSMNEKWNWLLLYLYENAGTSTNRTALGTLIERTWPSSDQLYAISYEFRAFLQSKQYRSDSSTYATCDYSRVKFQEGFWEYLSSVETTDLEDISGKYTLPTPYTYYYDFAGWYKDANYTDGPYITVDHKATLYAKWIETNPVTSVNIENPITEIELYNHYTLKWNIAPLNANIQDVEFSTSSASIATVDEQGYIQTLSAGKVTITAKSLSKSEVEATLEIEVYKPDHFEISYETNSYCNIGEQITLNCEYVTKDNAEHHIVWASKDEGIATVDEDGVVTGVASGVVTITATVEGTDKSIDFVVTVLETNLSEVLQYILKNHNSTAKTVYNLGIGAGVPDYYYDVCCSVNNILFADLTIDRTYYDKLPLGTKNNGLMNSVEFITVHYTGNMNYLADADNNADYFNNLGYAASIHYVTGRTNLEKYGGEYSEDNYVAFADLNEKYKGWHASDSGMGEHKWLATGVMVESTDPETPVISISENSKWTINGKETTVTIPSRDDGIVVTGPTFVKNGVTYNSINSQGIAWKIIEGQYYIGNTWWGTQQAGYTLTNIGGNHNSIGIESCVDKGINLVHNWHLTAQLVADIMDRYDLDISRVQGHHFFSGKDCPQPLLENNGELWDEFINMVKAEYERITTFKDYEISMEIIDAGDDNLSKLGLLTQTAESQVVVYKVTVTKDGKSESITLATSVESFYTCKCYRSFASLQVSGFPII